jgi:hypothetical protein
LWFSSWIFLYLTLCVGLFECSLHYTTVELGTPGVKFMVALDTGSDLFWVPCDCTRCAATDSSAFASSALASVSSRSYLVIQVNLIMTTMITYRVK